MPGDRRHPPAQRAGAKRGRQGGQPRRDHDRVDRQDRRIDAVMPCPSAEVGPVGLVGFDRPRGDRLTGIVGRLGHRVGQRSIDQRQQIGRNIAAAHQPPDQSLGGGIGPGWGGRRQDLALHRIGRCGGGFAAISHSGIPFRRSRRSLY